MTTNSDQVVTLSQLNSSNKLLNTSKPVVWKEFGNYLDKSVEIKQSSFSSDDNETNQASSNSINNFLDKNFNSNQSILSQTVQYKICTSCQRPIGLASLLLHYQKCIEMKQKRQQEQADIALQDAATNGTANNNTNNSSSSTSTNKKKRGRNGALGDGLDISSSVDSSRNNTPAPPGGNASGGEGVSHNNANQTRPKKKYKKSQAQKQKEAANAAAAAAAAAAAGTTSATASATAPTTSTSPSTSNSMAANTAYGASATTGTSTTVPKTAPDKPPKKTKKGSTASSQTQQANAKNSQLPLQLQLQLHALLKSKQLVKPKGPVDVEKQCGVALPSGGLCARSLTCKTHSMGAKRAVLGRSAPYDVLLQQYQKRNQAKIAQNNALAAQRRENAAFNDDGSDVNLNNANKVLDPDEETHLVLEGLSKNNPIPLERKIMMPVRYRHRFLQAREFYANALIVSAQHTQQQQQQQQQQQGSAGGALGEQTLANQAISGSIGGMQGRCALINVDAPVNPNSDSQTQLFSAILGEMYQVRAPSKAILTTAQYNNLQHQAFQQQVMKLQQKQQQQQQQQQQQLAQRSQRPPSASVQQ